MADLLILPKLGRIKISDGTTPTPLTYTSPCVLSDFKEDGEVRGDGYKTETVMVRQKPLAEVTTDRDGCGISFSAVGVYADGAVTLENVVKLLGDWAAAVSTSDDPGDVVHLQVELEFYDGAAWVPIREYKYVVLTDAFSEGAPTAKVSVKGKAVAYADDWRTVTL